MNDAKTKQQLKDIVYHDSDVKKILSLIQSTVKGCLPEKRQVCAWEDAMERDEFEDLGFNTSIDTITANLKEKGLL